jgi:3-deoxy-D-manno-octulosonic-acid transferase
MFFLYQAGIWLYLTGIRIAAIRSEKAHLWLKGRKDQQSILQSLRKKDERWVWFHCASLGEFEQGRPVIEALRAKAPQLKILLSFFSPSGYEVRKNYTGADRIVYLPMDTPGNVQKFLDALQPEFVVFVKYEFWFGYLRALKKRNIPTFLISSRFRADQHFFQFWGSWFRKQLQCFTEIHVQDNTSADLLQQAGYRFSTVSGDSRYDRVAANASHPTSLPLINHWLGGRKALVAGSTWSEDDAVIFPWLMEDWVVIVAPHEVTEERIRTIENRCGTSVVRYSTLTDSSPASQVLILDNVGMLLSAYALGKIAYVGGAFGKGLHNILEPAACGLPVIFGPKHRKFLEAGELIAQGGGWSIETREDFLGIFEKISQPAILLEKSQVCQQFVHERTGATELVLRSLLKHI